MLEIFNDIFKVKVTHMTKKQQLTSSNKKIDKENQALQLKIVILNLRGTKFEIPLSALDNRPETRLGKLKDCLITNTIEDLKELCDDFDMSGFEFYFNKDPYPFYMILEYYNGEKIHFDDKICPNHFKNQLKYWGLNELDCFDECCEYKFFDKCENIREDLDKQKNVIANYEFKHDFSSSYFPKMRENLWMIIEKPRSSKIANVKRIIFFKSLLKIRENHSLL